MRALQRRFRKKNPIVGENADRIAEDMGEAADQGGAVERLELVEFAAIDDARDHIADIVGFAHVIRDDAVNLACFVQRVARGFELDIRLLYAIEIADDAPRDRQRMRIVERVMIRHA